MTFVEVDIYHRMGRLRMLYSKIEYVLDMHLLQKNAQVIDVHVRFHLNRTWSCSCSLKSRMNSRIYVDIQMS